MNKEILFAIVCFTLSAIVMTLVGNIVCPEIGNIAASYYAVPAPDAKPADKEDTVLPKQTGGEKAIEIAKADPKSAEIAEGKDKEGIISEPDEAAQTDVAIQTREGVAESPVPGKPMISEPLEKITDVGSEMAERISGTRPVPEETAFPAQTGKTEKTDAEPVGKTEKLADAAEQVVPSQTPGSVQTEKDADVQSPAVKPSGLERSATSEQTEEADARFAASPADMQPGREELASPSQIAEDAKKTVTETAKTAIDVAASGKPLLSEQAVKASVSEVVEAASESEPAKAAKASVSEVVETTAEPEKTVPKVSEVAEKLKTSVVKAAWKEALPDVQSPEKAVSEATDAKQPVEEPKEVAAKAVRKLTPEDISKLTKSLKNGESIELGDGRVAYKVKSGDSFSKICGKIIGTSKTWRTVAKKMDIDYRRIHPGKVLIFETATE